MLKDGEAVAVRTKPFTIRLAYETGTKELQPVTLGIDPGRTNIGMAAETNGKCIYLSHCETRNKEIPKLMKKRKEHRKAYWRGERLRRKRKAEKNGTNMLHFVDTGMGRRPMAVHQGDGKPAAAHFPDVYEVLQFRHHNRARINAQVERTYKYDGKTVAKNRHKRISADTGSKKKKAAL